MQMNEKLYQAFLDEMHELENFRMDYASRHPSASLDRDDPDIKRLVEASLAPALWVVAEQGGRWYQGEIDEACKHHPNLTVKRMSGPHHIHLEPEVVAQVASYTREFLGLDDSGDEIAA